MEVCPHCHRRLISHASARCNWCGQIIDDPNYQAQAQVNREAFLVEQAVHDAQRVAWNAIVNGVGSFGDPTFGPIIPADPVLTHHFAVDAAERAAARARRLGPPIPPQPVAPPANQIQDLPSDEPEGDRFRHLELE